MKGLNKRNGIWHIDTQVNGQRLRCSTKRGDYREACKVFRRLKEEFVQEQELKADRGGSRPFSKAAEVALTSLWADNSTLKEARQKVKLLTVLLNDPDVRDITVVMLEELKDRLRAGEGGRKHGERAPRTVNKYMSTVITILKNEMRLGFIQSYPTARKYSVKSQKRILTQEELDSLFSYFEERDTDFADACKVLLDTGMRTGELTQLAAFHVDFNNNAIVLRQIKTKSGRGRTIPMTDRVREIMQRRTMANNSKIFPYDSPDNYRQRWKKWRRTRVGGMEDRALTPHALRHTCCTRLLAATQDIYATQKWMGHASIVTTEEYLSLVPGQLENAAKKLGALNEGLTTKAVEFHTGETGDSCSKSGDFSPGYNFMW